MYRTVPVALTEAAQLRADGTSSCCYIQEMYTILCHGLRQARKAWPGILLFLLDPCFLSGWVFVKKADFFANKAECLSSGEIQYSLVCVDAVFAQNATLVSKTQAEYYLLLREKKAT